MRIAGKVNIDKSFTRVPRTLKWFNRLLEVYKSDFKFRFIPFNSHHLVHSEGDYIFRSIEGVLLFKDLNTGLGNVIVNKDFANSFKYETIEYIVKEDCIGYYLINNKYLIKFIDYYTTYRYSDFLDLNECRDYITLPYEKPYEEINVARSKIIENILASN